nr:unnamed protein product [Callosobruchus analis]
MDDFDFFDDDVEVVDIVEYGIPRRFYQRPNYFEELVELSFFKRFRLYKNTVMTVLLRIEHQLEYSYTENNSVSPISQVLYCLRYFSSSGHLIQTADFMHMDVSTASRIVKMVSQAIARLFAAYVKMPQEQDFVREQTKFYAIAKFPRVIGIVDGTHIRIQSPGDSGYPVKKYLMTPLRNPSTRAQQLYNDALRLHMDGIKAAIVATTVLHNIAREMNEPTPPMPDGIDLSELNYLIETENVNTEAMENVNTNWVQNQIVNTHFGG